jgi:protein-arginine kinase activator protein McsA
MNKNRFRLDRAKKSFDCYDCRKDTIVGSEFAWDNLRNCKICEPCLKKLSDMVEGDKERESKAAAEAVIKSDSERIQALEEQVNTLSLQVMHLKSMWWNEIRTYSRMSAEATNRRLQPLASNQPSEGFKLPSEVTQEYKPWGDVLTNTPLADGEEIPF